MKLIRVVIAEDEPPVTRFVKDIIEKFGGFEVVSLCENGEDAVRAVTSKQPELLVTDIRMPGISGLDLIRKVKKINSEIRVIIISGYRTFDYAKEAIGLGVEEYISKPIDQEELKRKLSQIAGDHKKEFWAIRRAFIEKAIFNKDEGLFLKNFNFLSFRLFIAYRSGDQTEEISCLDSCNHHTVAIAFSNAVMFLEGYDTEMKAEFCLEGIRQKYIIAKDEKRTRGFILIRKVATGQEPVRTLRKLYKLMENLITPGKRVEAVFEDFEEISADKSDLDDEIMNKLKIDINSYDWKQFRKDFDELLLVLKQAEASIARIKLCMHALTGYLEKVGAFSDDFVSLNEYFDDCISYADSFDEIDNKLTAFWADIFFENYQNSKKVKKNEKDLVERIVNLIRQNESRNYSLQEISVMFGVSQPYIRKIFRLHLGESYNEYTLSLKINIAKEMMKSNPEMLVKDIADSLGFEQLYFGTIFRKNVGMSPSQYKTRFMK